MDGIMDGWVIFFFILHVFHFTLALLFLGYRTQKTLHEPPQKGLSSQQHSFLYRWISDERNTKIESRTHTFHSIQLKCFAITRLVFINFKGNFVVVTECDQIFSTSSCKVIETVPYMARLIFVIARGGLSYIRRERVSACFFLFQGNFSQKRE